NEEACVRGTNEVVRPLLSSALTTCSVFLPMVFISGMVGALLFDQAMAVSIGLFSSFAVSITLIPVYYLVLNTTDRVKLNKSPNPRYIMLYERLLLGVFRRPLYISMTVLAIVIGGVFIFKDLPKEKLPAIEQDEFFVYVNWNEKINIEENKSRCVDLLQQVAEHRVQSSIYAGSQQFIMGQQSNLSQHESRIYIKVNSPEILKEVGHKIESFVKNFYSQATLEFLPAENMFELIFGEQEAELTAKIKPISSEMYLEYPKMNALVGSLFATVESTITSVVPMEEYMEISLNLDRLMIYNISLMQVTRKIQSLFNQYHLTDIKTGKGYVPVVLGTSKASILTQLQSSFVQNLQGVDIPLRELITTRKVSDFKSIIAGRSGEYFPVDFVLGSASPDILMKEINLAVRNDGEFEIEWTGSLFSNHKMILELSVILVVSLLLLYFILAAQFESLTLPIIILLEAPIDIAAAFLFLKFFGLSINIMSLIGVIVMVGIVINDSILKIDTINRLRKEGVPVISAIFIAGKRRLKPILMTSLTTIFAMLPFLFVTGMGADIQKPLAVSVIGGMTVGTLVSIFFIPYLYYFLFCLENDKLCINKKKHSTLKQKP
ncbi:MAG: efflux RND transporter permease subunit, partial [Salinivirgaceae bacterium]|nr:efflux RND transporter permease subunit [Salinivirgaceae bacterium]